MKVTKFTHACLLIEEGKSQILIDPGIFSKDVPKLKNLSAIFVTHLHPDHLNEDWLKQYQQNNPTTPIYAPKDVAQTYPDIKFQEVEKSQLINVDSFSVDCILTDHALVHSDLPRPQNMTVLVNDNLYYPGDSFLVPKKTVQTLACPASAPWLKISEAIDYIQKLKPVTTFPTHDGILSDNGKSVHYRILSGACQKVDAEWTELKPKESIDI